MSEFCCERFAKEAGEYQAPVGGGFYPSSLRPDAQFEKSDDGTWSINGCCGGGCFVVTEMKFCPFCGINLRLNKGILQQEWKMEREIDGEVWQTTEWRTVKEIA